VRSVFLTSDSVSIEVTYDGRPGRGGFRFVRGRELQTLIDAIKIADDPTVNLAPRNVGVVKIKKSGAEIEVGAARGLVLLRWRLPDGRTTSSTRIYDEELAALRLAAAEMQKTARARRFARARD
jgi:hypothetical protein